MIKQLSVFIENKSGRLGEITSVIAKANIDIMALSISDTTDFGILRLIVDKPVEAEKVLRDAGLTVSLTNVIVMGIANRPGGFAEAMGSLSKSGIGVEYMYAISRGSEKGYLVLRVADEEKASKVLSENGCDVVSESELASL